MRAARLCWVVVLALGGLACRGHSGGPFTAAGEAASRARCANNLRSLGLTFQAYREGRGHLPVVAITDPQGKPLLSWRVTILPWIKVYDRERGEIADYGFDRLYKMFRLDEPWDSPHNIALLEHMPTIYLCPSEGRSAREGLTNYRVVAGPSTIFEGLEGVESSKVDEGFITRDGQPSAFGTASDGLGDTLMLFESSQAIPWTKPDDLTFGPNLPAPPLGSKHPGEFLIVLADGSVRGIKAATPPERIRALITRNGADAPP